MKLKIIESLDEFYGLIEANQIEVKIMLRPYLFTRHRFWMDEDIIGDFSFVDESTSEYTKEEFEESIYAEAIQKKVMVLEEVMEIEG